MVGWEGTPLQHETFSGLTVQSCCQLWLKSEPPKVLFWGWAMPGIVATDLKLLGERATKWIEQGQRLGFRCKPSQLTLELRLADEGAAASFSIVTFRNAPFVQACDRCGLWTASWCEGCYSRAVCDPSLEFAALCTDQDKLVCNQCVSHGKTWEEGHSAYQAHFARRSPRSPF